MVTFLHTGDWQLGKPFHGIADADKRARVRQARFDAVGNIAELARDPEVSFVLVAGDLFDSPTADKNTVAAACNAIAQIPKPVYVIPGNHDHGGPGGIWGQPFFEQARAQSAANLTVLLEPKPLVLADAVLLPCPLQRRHERLDTTAWLRAPEPYRDLPPGLPRIALAHGSTQQFTMGGDEDAGGATEAVNYIDPNALPLGDLDYVALGDWHGMQEVAGKVWYAGTHELDRFPKGGQNPGHVLRVTAQRGAPPGVQALRTGNLPWAELEFRFADDAGLAEFNRRLEECFPNKTTGLLRLSLHGPLGLEADKALTQALDYWEAHLLRIKLERQTTLKPSAAEVEALVNNGADPLIAAVAGELVRRIGAGEDAAVASLALSLLHAQAAQGARA